MSTTLSTLNTRLNEVLKSSETRNLTSDQRTRALSDALVFDVQNYRPWPDLVKNAKTQAVSGIINIPADFRKELDLHYGADASASAWEKYQMVDQTDFLQLVNNTSTVTDSDGTQVLKVYPTDDQGVDQSNQTADTDLGLFDASARTRLFQTFTTDTTDFKGAMLRLKTTGTPTGTLTVSLYATSSSLPTGSALASDTLAVADITSSYENYYFDLTYTTTDATEYAIVLSTSSSVDASNYVNWQYSATSQISDGTRGVYDGATYTTATGDMYFLTYSECFSFQYLKTLTALSASTDTTGVDSAFDEAIVMLAGARLYERLGGVGTKDQDYTGVASILRYGAGGNSSNPTPDSAYGKLNTLWDEERTRTRRPLQRFQNIYEKYGTGNSRANVDKSYLARL